jgi:hypothetical protein
LCSDADLQRTVFACKEGGNRDETKGRRCDHEAPRLYLAAGRFVRNLTRERYLFGRRQVRLPICNEDRCGSVGHMEIMAERGEGVRPPVVRGC